MIEELKVSYEYESKVKHRLGRIAELRGLSNQFVWNRDEEYGWDAKTTYVTRDEAVAAGMAAARDEGFKRFYTGVVEVQDPPKVEDFLGSLFDFERLFDEDFDLWLAENGIATPEDDATLNIAQWGKKEQTYFEDLVKANVGELVAHLMKEHGVLPLAYWTIGDTESHSLPEEPK